MTHLCKISFPNTNVEPISLPVYANLSEHLTLKNSPVLFGCRTGICGTCLVKITGDIPLPKQSEKDLLEVLSTDDSSIRLACQINLTSDIEISKVD